MKYLWIFPLAAILCGTPVNPPRLKAPLPEFPKNSCRESARREILLAYAYRGESAPRSLRHLAKADAILRKCEVTRLRTRWAEFKNSTP